jgi:PKD repeat protein
VQTNLAIEIGTLGADPADPSGFSYTPEATGTFPAESTTSSVPMTGAGATFALGGVQDGGGSPVAAPGGPYSGTEGSPISFDGSGSTGGCGPLSDLQWQFSDGGSASGATPQHTFADNGTYTGQLTATDTTGATSTTAFSITVANVAPSVNAGADATTDWGQPVTFTGQATDPSSVDQSTLQYSWDFGDGTPPATGTATPTHAYATPGALGYYDATLTVCDKDAGCNSDVRRVTVTKRDTTTTYSGDTSGTFDSPGTVRASMVDEYGENVVGRTVNFQVGADGPFGVVTNTNGVAATSYTPTLPAGSFTGSSSFAGDSLYKASSDTFSFAESRNASNLAYTGDTSGHPNTPVNLRAVLTDENGKPIAGRTIVFLLDTQLTTATTDAHGVASTTVPFLKRSGLPIVLAGWIPTGADSRRYWGSADGGFFRVQPR